MPSAQPLPTVADLLKAYGDAVTGQKDNRADMHRGSGYDHFAGLGAILYSRQAQRDRDLFRAVYFDTAEGDELTAQGTAKFQNPRILDTYGIGTATLMRPTAGAGGGTFWAGTRILVSSGAGVTDPKTYVVTQDTPVSAAATSATVPIRASVFGAGSAANLQTSTGGVVMRVDDVLWDTTWSVTALVCADGTSFESPAVYRARVRQNRLDNRKGYLKAIIAACVAAGAVNVVAFPSYFVAGATDYGTNFVYVGDAGYNATQTLINKCLVAIESARVAGADLQVLGMQPSPLTIAATVNLWDDPGLFNTTDLTLALSAALLTYFDGRANAYAYRLDAMTGALTSASQAVQNVTWTTPASDVTVTTGSPPQFPAVISRYTAAAQNMTFTFAGPQ